MVSSLHFRPDVSSLLLLMQIIAAAASASFHRQPSSSGASCRCALAFSSPPPRAFSAGPHRPLPPESSSPSSGVRTPHRRRSSSATRRRDQQQDGGGGEGGGGGGGGAEEEARRLRRRAEELREQARDMESKMGDERLRRGIVGPPPAAIVDDDDGAIVVVGGGINKKSLRGKRVLVVGANGRLGSMVARRLLRSHPEVREVVAAVHYAGRATTRGYGRLSYEVGAEDGKGAIGSAWSEGDDANASFAYDPEVMSGYNLDKLRVVEVELLDPIQVRTITEDVDAVIYCATDFEGNRPRAVSSLNVAFLFRAVASPTKGRVEIEGVRNVLEGLTSGINERRWKEQRRMDQPGATVYAEGGVGGGDGPTQFVLVSTSPDAYGTFETPFGEFNGLKRQGERMTMKEFPSISHSVLQMGKFDDNFVEEGRELRYDTVSEEGGEDTVVVDGVVSAIGRGVGVGGGVGGDGMQKRINRRDAARAAVDALLKEEIEGKKVRVYTAVRKTDIW